MEQQDSDEKEHGSKSSLVWLVLVESSSDAMRHGCAHRGGDVFGAAHHRTIDRYEGRKRSNRGKLQHVRKLVDLDFRDAFPVIALEPGGDIVDLLCREPFGRDRWILARAQRFFRVALQVENARRSRAHQEQAARPMVCASPAMNAGLAVEYPAVAAELGLWVNAAVRILQMIRGRLALHISSIR